jgi:hypothetical protein
MARLPGIGERVTPSTEILIGDPNAQHVVLRPLTRRHPSLFESDEGNWIDCEVQIAVGGFRGSFRADLRSEEFQTFREEVETLNSALEGTATFSTMEEQVAMTLSGNGRGAVRVSGEAMDATGTGNRLTFHFVIDQTYLPEISRSLGHLLAAFPVIAAPDA